MLEMIDVYFFDQIKQKKNPYKKSKENYNWKNNKERTVVTADELPEPNQPRSQAESNIMSND